MFRLASKGLDFHNILEEIPVTIKTSNLANVLISEVIGENEFSGKEEFMSLSTGYDNTSYSTLFNKSLQNSLVHSIDVADVNVVKRCF